MAEKLKPKFVIKTAFVKYYQSRNGKWRPVLIFQGYRYTFIWKITTKYLSKSQWIRKHYFPLFHWWPYGLNRPSYVDVNYKFVFRNQVYKQTDLSRRPVIWRLNDSDSIQFIKFYRKAKTNRNN